MTIPHLLEGLAAGLNIGADFTTVAGAAGLLGSPDPASGSFDLDALDRHNFPIEHDASLSRQDAYFGDDYSFYRPNWQQVLSYYDGDSFTNIPHAAAARYSRVLSSRATNQKCCMALGNSSSRMARQRCAAPISYVRSLFEQEKLPFDLGWRPSPLPITFASLSVMAAELQAGSNETPPGDAQIGAQVRSSSRWVADPERLTCSVRVATRCWMSSSLLQVARVLSLLSRLVSAILSVFEDVHKPTT
ncbi:hypothetical protein LTS14_008244 [Recurvomyces mirabilis]|nr:hypothetical protein LTS14_008244 [Recurvomyces mirabilis]